MNVLKITLYVLITVLSVRTGTARVERIIPSSQSPYHYHILYDMFLEFDGYRIYRADLYAGNTNALFFYQIENMNRPTTADPVESGPDDFRFEVLDTARYFIASDRVKNHVYQLERMPTTEQFCVTNESLKRVEWELTGRKKTIDAFECEEARGQVGGRDYTVWYCEQLPLSFGPWKLHGLPGVVLEAYDATQEVRFLARSIKQIDTDRSMPSPDLDTYPMMERTAYIELLKTYVDGLERRMMSRFDRSFRVKVTSSPIKSIEIHDD